MPYPPLINFSSEADCQAHFERIYCCGPIMTFDEIAVRFRKSDFKHCFFESVNAKDDTFSPKRAARIDWIKAALEDVTSERFVGWDSKKKRYDRNRRVTVVMGNYVVVMAITGHKTASFITAYVADSPRTPSRPRNTLDMIRQSPRWPH